MDGEPGLKSGTSSLYTGVALAVISTLFIGASFIIKKKALIRLQSRGNLRAGAGGFGYLKEWLWWGGLVTMGIGEVANFAAYAFAPASLVTPLGALSILVSASLASFFLHERLNFLGKLGCLLCILGSTVIVLHSPKVEDMGTLSDFSIRLRAPLFLSYSIVVVISSLMIVFYFGPKCGQRNVTIYIFLCSSVGSLSVMGCKGLGLALREISSGKTNLDHSLLWFLLITVIVCICTQMNYLNKALDLFTTGIVTPVYYVLFTSLVILASSILLNEWVSLSWSDVVGSLCGLFTVLVAIVLLNGFKDIDISLSDVHSSLKAKPKNRAGSRVKSDTESLLPRHDVNSI